VIAARLARTIGRGAVAGFAGTAAMTVSSTVEAKLRGRAFSTAPARAAQRVLGIKEFESPRDVARFSDLVHWGYGTGWGVVRALLGEVGLGSRLATPAHFGALWGSELVMLPSLDVAPPAYLWPKQEVAIDVFHHLVYALTTGVAYELLDHRS
jgi:uncharacterized membrane protein YagU involved in acid resistance